MDPKRMRGRNFTEGEKNFLFEVVTTKYKSILENKQSDAVITARKNLAWQEIAREFNSQNQTGHRTAKQLHALYDNLKKTARSNLYSDKKNAYKTGGGTFTPKSSSLDHKIVTVLQPQFEPLQNKYDSSASYIETQPQPSCSFTNIIENYNIEDLPLDSEFTINESSNTAVPAADSSPSPTPSVASETAPSEQQIHTARAGQKRKQLGEKSVPKKRRPCVDTLSNRFVQRKNFKDQHDAELQTLKIDILNIEKQVKSKQLAVVEQQLQNEKKMFELNYKNRLEEIEFERKVRQMKLNMHLDNN